MTVTRKDVTTAEAALLIGEHHKSFGDVPLKVIDGTEKEIEVSPTQLYSYLMTRFGAKKVKNLYPSATSRFPETFEEAQELGMSTVNPSEKLMTFELK